MANLQVNLQVPIRTTMLDTSGKIVLEWQNFFTALVQAVIGAQEAQFQANVATNRAGDVKGAPLLNTTSSIPMVAFPGVLTQAAVGEASLVVTYLTGTPGAGQSSHTVTFTNGIETAHT